MTSESYVNSQITGSIAQTNLSVLGNAPSEAMAILYQQMAHTIGLALQNVISQQQHSYSIHNAITIAASKQLLSTDPAAAAKASQDLLAGSAIPENLAALQAVVNDLGKQQ